MTGCIKIRIFLEQTNPKYKNDLSCGAIKYVNVTNIIDRKQFEDFKLFEVINVFTRGTQQKPMLCALLSKEIFPSEVYKYYKCFKLFKYI
jgi:hypothetical protein